MKQTQKGFSLVQTLVAVGLAGGVGLILMQQQDTSSRMQVKNNVNQVINSASQMIQQSLASRAICTESLKGRGPGDTIPFLVNAEVNPNDYNTFIVHGHLIDPGVPLEGPNAIGGTQIDEMKIITDGGKDYLEVKFNADPMKKKKMVGSEITKKRFQLQGQKNGSGKYTLCLSESANLVDTSSAEACKSLGGTIDANKKCKLDMTQLVDATSVSCNLGSKYYPKVENGKIAFGCTPCTHTNVWDHYECGKPFSGMNWVNMCYYKTVCAEDHSTVISGVAWDGKAGPTNASGGDTGTKNNCHERRRKCSGE